jgi:hypothetical protein
MRHTMVHEFAAKDRFSRFMLKGGYIEVESSESYYVQAADFAAGIASDLFSRERLTGVVLRFEYVTYNGRRISLADAEEEIKRQRIQ